MDWIQSLIPSGVMITILILLIRFWATSLQENVNSKVSQDVYEVWVDQFKEEISNVNTEVKESFDKIIKKLDDQVKTNGDVKVEIAKLTQRVDDLVKNGSGK